MHHGEHQVCVLMEVVPWVDFDFVGEWEPIFVHVVVFDAGRVDFATCDSVVGGTLQERRQSRFITGKAVQQLLLFGAHMMLQIASMSAFIRGELERSCRRSRLREHLIDGRRI